jgi:hypothetical protein
VAAEFRGVGGLDRCTIAADGRAVSGGAIAARPQAARRRSGPTGPTTLFIILRSLKNQ